jgi:hypothetical protein
MSAQEPFVACVECKRPQGDSIHDPRLSVTDTGQSQHVFIPGPILNGGRSAGGRT